LAPNLAQTNSISSLTEPRNLFKSTVENRVAPSSEQTMDKISDYFLMVLSVDLTFYARRRTALCLKNCAQNVFCNKFVKCLRTLIIFGTQIAQRIGYNFMRGALIFHIT